MLPTADGHIILAVGNAGQFRDFCAAAGVKFCDDPKFASNEARVHNRVELTAALNTIMQRKSTAQWVSVLETAQVPCGPINTLDQVYADPQVIARNAVEHVTRSDGTPLTLAANPLRMSETPPTTQAAPPMLGENTDSALMELLALSEAELARLREAHVI